jgi:hypothetical protein
LSYARHIENKKTLDFTAFPAISRVFHIIGVTGFEPVGQRLKSL